jgi:GTPase SAR1 family protein
MQADWTFDVAICGASQTGKTALMRALMDQTYDNKYRQTLGSEHGNFTGICQGESICLSMTSLSGQSRLLPITQKHLMNKHAIIITYSINDVASFKESQFWVQEAARSSPSATISLVGCKTDLASNASLRAVQGADATQQAKAWGSSRHYSCSSAKDENVAPFRSQLMQEILKQHGHKSK